MRVRSWVALLLLFGAACRDEKRSADGGQPPTLLKLPSPGLTVRWLVPEAAVRSPLRVLRRVGRHRALIGEWEVDDRRGVVGETPSQSTVARLGLDDQDTLYGAGPTSMLFRTTIGERDVALASGRRVPEPGARAISVPSGDDVRGGSVAGAVIVIPSGDTVLVSRTVAIDSGAPPPLGWIAWRP